MRDLQAELDRRFDIQPGKASKASVWMICPNGHSWHVTVVSSGTFAQDERRSRISSCPLCRAHTIGTAQRVRVPARRGYTRPHPDLTDTVAAAHLLGDQRMDLYPPIAVAEVHDGPYKHLWSVELAQAYLRFRKRHQEIYKQERQQRRAAHKELMRKAKREAKGLWRS